MRLNKKLWGKKIIINYQEKSNQRNANAITRQEKMRVGKTWRNNKNYPKTTINVNIADRIILHNNQEIF